jgi:Zn-finger nucleic acid-binding protein
MIVECPGCHSRYDVTGRPAGTRARCRCGTSFVLGRPPESAAMLKCPNCGAACDPSRARCGHCDVALALVACPRCFGRVFAGSRHCQHCGVEVDAPARPAPDGKPSGRKCPRCGKPHPTELVAHLVAETLLDECPRCSGVWVDRGALEKVVTDRDRQAAIQALGGSAITPHALPGSKQPLVYLHCPDCDQIMNRTNFGKRSGVIIDVCKPHGVWFDCDELGQVIDFIMRGGLDEARRREMEDLKRDIENKKKQLAGIGGMGAALPMDGTYGRHLHRGKPDLAGTLLDLMFGLLD